MIEWHWSQVPSSIMEGLINISKNNIFGEVVLMAPVFNVLFNFGVLRGFQNKMALFLVL